MFKSKTSERVWVLYYDIPDAANEKERKGRERKRECLCENDREWKEDRKEDRKKKTSITTRYSWALN